MLSEYDVVACRRCRAPIWWAVTAAKHRQAVNAVPVDAEPDPAGRLALYRDDTGRLRVRTLTKERAELEHAEVRGMAHAATCGRPTAPVAVAEPEPEAAASAGRLVPDYIVDIPIRWHR
ncbi:hypothetical protein [Streptomyces sp. CAU 1734]|uniref:hypothetical protein n=1 Tax=Streptomyces sp. CAU 1734 TaxID=3140360 RepID=UPI0032602254